MAQPSAIHSVHAVRVAGCRWYFGRIDNLNRRPCPIDCNSAYFISQRHCGTHKFEIRRCQRIAGDTAEGVTRSTLCNKAVASSYRPSCSAVLAATNIVSSQIFISVGMTCQFRCLVAFCQHFRCWQPCRQKIGSGIIRLLIKPHRIVILDGKQQVVQRIGIAWLVAQMNEPIVLQLLQRFTEMGFASTRSSSGQWCYYQQVPNRHRKAYAANRRCQRGI